MEPPWELVCIVVIQKEVAVLSHKPHNVTPRWQRKHQLSVCIHTVAGQMGIRINKIIDRQHQSTMSREKWCSGFHFSLPLPQKETQHVADVDTHFLFLLMCVDVRHHPIAMARPTYPPLPLHPKGNQHMPVSFKKIGPASVLGFDDRSVQLQMVAMYEVL